MQLDMRADALAADARIGAYIRRTPLEFSPLLSELAGARVYLKLENYQHTGSFKVRGAFNKLLSLNADERARGVVTASTGNHGAAVAYGIAKLEIKGIVFVPESASQAKVATIRRLGADVRFFGEEGGATEVHARTFAAERGMPYVSPYNDADVIAGQATIGVEMLRELPAIDAVVASLGGGGLISGVAGVLKATVANAFALAVSARNSKAMMDSIAAGRVVSTRHLPTLSDGTAGGIEEGTITFDLCRALVDRFVEIDEASIRTALKLLVESHHILVEGSAALAVAGLLAEREALAGRTVAVIICGANIDAHRLREALA